MTNPSVGGASTGAAAGGSSATVPMNTVGGGSMSGGGSSSPLSVILSQNVPQATVDSLTGVSFTVANGPPGTAGVFYSYAATPPTRASETNYCGYPTSYVYTCDGYQPGCLTITIDSMQHATASFLDASGTQRFFAGYVYAVKAPLAPITIPQDYSFIGNFEFTSTEGLELSIKGSFSVRFAAALAGSGIQLLIIC